MGCKKDNACKESRSEAAVHFVPPIYSDGRAITLVGQAQSLLADSRRATIKRIGGLQPCNLDLCQYAFKDRRKGVRGGPRALQGISVDTRLSRQRSILSNEGFEIAMPRAWEKLHPLVSDTLEGRAGSSGTFARRAGTTVALALRHRQRSPRRCWLRISTPFVFKEFSGYHRFLLTQTCPGRDTDETEWQWHHDRL